MLRDFTDAEKDKLLGFVDADQQKNDSRILGGVTDWFADGINYGGLDISDYVNNMEAYHKKLIDKNDMARKDITDLFDAVHAVDDTYKTQFADKCSLLQAYNDTLVSLTNLITINSVDPSASNIYMMPIDFLQKTAGSTQDLTTYYVDKYTITNPDGTTTYDWEAIDATLNNDASDISEMEYCVLANLYADMSNEDAAKFLQAMADKVEDVSYEWYQQIGQQHIPSEYTTWTYNSEKISHLEFYINYEANVYGQYAYLIDTGTTEQLSQIYPDMNPEDFNYVFRKTVSASYDAERRNSLQRSSLLSLCASLGQSAFGNDSETNWLVFTYTYENGDLTGPKDAFGPQISLSEGENGYLNMTFCNSQTMIYPSSSSSGMSWSQSMTDHLTENSLTVSYVGSDVDAADIINNSANTYYSAEFAFNPVDVAAGDLQNFAIGQLRDAALTGFKAAPLVGLGMDMAMNMAKAYDESQQRLKDVSNTFDSMNVSLYYSRFAIDATVISDGSSENIVVGYPTFETQEIVDNINQYVKEFNVDMSVYNLPDQISVSDIMNNAPDVEAFIKALDVSIRDDLLT